MQSSALVLQPVHNSARLIQLRWLAGLGVLFATPLSIYSLGLPLPERELLSLGAVILGYNFGLYWALRPGDVRQEPPIFATGQVLFDWLALTVFVHFTGGIESPAIAFFLFHVIVAPILFSERTAYISAVSVIVLVASVAGLEAYGVVPHYAVLMALPPALYKDPLYVAGVLGFFTATMLVAAYVVVQIVAELREHQRRLTALYESIAVLPSSLDLSCVLDQLVAGVAHGLQVKAASIRLLDETGTLLKIRASYGLSESYLEKGAVELSRSPIDQQALKGGPVIVSDASDDARLQYRADVVNEGIRSILCVALLGRRGAIGVLRVYHWKPAYFTDRDGDFVIAVARQGTMAIENAMTYGELQRTDRMKSQFVRAVTHELRSPVAASQSLLRMVTRDLAGSLNELQRDVLLRLSQRLDSLQALIDDLLDLAAGKVEGLQAAPMPVSVEVCVLNVVERLSSQAAEKSVDVKVNYLQRGVMVMADEEGMSRIFLNLIGNAIKYTPAGGHVLVDFDDREGEVLVSVCDTGIGVPEADQAHVFEEFFRAANAKAAQIRGTGLGLAIVKDLVVRYGGRVWVKSTPGAGSTFTVSLPLSH